MPITLSLSGKVALITGGSRGIGAAAVRMFVAAGARVMFNYEKSKTQSERLVKELGKKNCAAIHCDYAATKGALISMVKGLSTELARHAIYVNSVAPGWVDTDMSATALHNPKTSKAIFSVIPLGRAAKPEEIAAPILFLCTNHAGFITGEVFNVNGGAVLVG